MKGAPLRSLFASHKRVLWLAALIMLAAASLVYTANAQTGTAARQMDATHTLTLQNRSGMAICYAYIVPAGAPLRGPDWLGQHAIPGAGGFTFWLEEGIYDIHLVSCPGAQQTRFIDVSISQDSTLTLAGW